MADPMFREAQFNHRFDPHIAPLNRLVDLLREDDRGWVPYIAPMYGGTGARLLSLLRDPGPKTQGDRGSGFLSMENDDATAEEIDRHFKAVAISAAEIVPWNVYPWYINRAPTARELNAGTEPLRKLIALLPQLRVVMLHGGSAQDGWRRFMKAHGQDAAVRQLHVISTYHTSRQAFRHPDPSIREARREHLRAAFREASKLLIG